MRCCFVSTQQSCRESEARVAQSSAHYEPPIWSSQLGLFLIMHVGEAMGPGREREPVSISRHREVSAELPSVPTILQQASEGERPNRKISSNDLLYIYCHHQQQRKEGNNRDGQTVRPLHLYVRYKSLRSLLVKSQTSGPARPTVIGSSALRVCIW